MNIWKILEIEETKDKTALQAAYRAKLTKTHPEDDPEGFMELRRAFEEAMEQADKTGEAVESEQDGYDWGSGPAGMWMTKVSELYDNFEKRVDPAEWRKLLREDVCMNLDTKMEVRSMLLEYMMEHFFLPQDVMQVLDEELELMENMDELKEEFPSEYLEYIIVRGIRYTERPLYRLLNGDPACDFDGYLHLNAQLNKCIESGETEKAHELIGEMSMMGISDPYIGISRAKVLSQEELYEAALEEAECVVNEYPEISEAHLMKGDICIILNDFEGARKAYSAALKNEPDDEWGRCGIAKCLMNEGKYEEAHEILSDIAESDPYDADFLETLNECNDKYIEQLKDSIRVSDDQKNYMDLAWCYYQNDAFDEAIMVLEQIEPDEEHLIEYKSIMGRCALYSDDFERALEYMKQWEAALEALPEGTEKEEKRSYQLPYCLMLQSFAYGEIGNTEEALRIIDKAIELAPEDNETLVQKGLLLSKQWYLEEAVEYFTKAIELQPEVHSVYIMRAKALFYMGFYGEAFDDCERALDLFPYELSAYVFKVKILIEAGEFDQADEELDYLKSENISGSELDFLRGFVLEARGKEEEAKSIYQKILAEHEHKKQEGDVFNVHNLAEVYHHLAVIESHKKYCAYSTIKNLMDKGIEEDPGYIQLAEMKAEVLDEYEMYEAALCVYREIAEEAPGRIGIYGAMDAIYRELDEWDKALECAEKQLMQTGSGYAYMRRGQIFAYMERNGEAEEDFRKAIELAPELSYPYNYMGVMKECEGNEEAAMEYYIKAIEVGEREEDWCDEAYQHAADLLCRKNQLDDALEMLERGLEFSEDPDFLLSMVYVYRRSGDFQEAREMLSQYAEEKNIKENSAEYIIQFAHIARDEGDMDEAYSLYDSICEEDTEAALEAGKILYYNGKYSEAVECFLEAANLFLIEDNDPEIIYLMGEHYLWAARAARDGGFPEQAAELAEEGLTYIAEDYELYHGSAIPMVEKILGGLYAVLGIREKALEYLNSALNRRKCDYCKKGYCTDACFELAYLSLLNEDYDKAFSILENASMYSEWDADLRGLKYLAGNRK